MFGGLILITVGCVIMLEKLGAHMPDWVISWPMFLLAIGLYSGFKNQFRKPMALVLIAIALLFVTDDIVPQMNITDFFWPLMFICIGGFLIMGRNRKGWKSNWRESMDEFNWKPAQPNGPVDPANPVAGPAGLAAGEPGASAEFSGFGRSSDSYEDFIDSVSVFGGVKKNITSRNFRGGEIVNFMGGAEVNLTQADFSGTIILDVTQIFGGTKIIVPPHWNVHSEMSAIFGGVEDKRPVHAETSDPSRKLVIKGTSIFGGIDIRSF